MFAMEQRVRAHDDVGKLLLIERSQRCFPCPHPGIPYLRQQSAARSGLASWWHTDSDLGRDAESFADMSKSREAGFLAARSTEASFAEKVTQYRAAGIIP